MRVLQNFVIGFSFIELISRRTLPLAIASITKTSSTTTAATMATDSKAYVAGSNSIAYVTTPNEESAKGIAHELIRKKLAACINIIPSITSIYEWEGKVNEDVECLMMIKTTSEQVDEMTKFVRENHPYSVAEVISVKIENGNPPYLDWVTKSVGKPSNKQEL